jgi:hypothetical protein
VRVCACGAVWCVRVNSFAHSGSLYTAIHATVGTSSEQAPLPWSCRLRIALDVASALHHLHQTTQVCMCVHVCAYVVIASCSRPYFIEMSSRPTCC